MSSTQTPGRVTRSQAKAAAPSTATSSTSTEPEDIKHRSSSVKNKAHHVSTSTFQANTNTANENQWMSGYLTKEGLYHLKQYKYASGFTGHLDKYVMIPLWNWSMQFVPMWIAPNVLTTMSLLCTIISYFLFHYYSPNLYEPAPNWVYGLSSFLIFFYLILDGLDGKQARRTGSSSPLGQLFDHGCDSICCFLCGIIMCSNFQYSGNVHAVVLYFIHLIPFFLSNWEEYCTGFMRFGLIGVSEGQLTIVLLLAISGIFGPNVWLQTLNLPFFGPTEYRYCATYLALSGLVYQATSSIYYAYDYWQEHKKEDAQSGGKLKKWYKNALKIFLFYCFFVIVAVAWTNAPSTFFAEHPRLLFIIVGQLFGYQVSRLIISRVTAEPWPFTFIGTMMIPYVLLTANSWLSEPLVPEYETAMVYAAVILVLYLHFVVEIVQQICLFLNIKCFSIPPPKVEPSH